MNHALRFVVWLCVLGCAASPQWREVAVERASRGIEGLEAVVNARDNAHLVATVPYNDGEARLIAAFDDALRRYPARASRDRSAVAPRASTKMAMAASTMVPPEGVSA